MEFLDVPCASGPLPHGTAHWRFCAPAGEAFACASDGLDRLAAAVGGLTAQSACTSPPPLSQAAMGEAAVAQAAHALVSAATDRAAQLHRSGCTAAVGLAPRRVQRADHAQSQAKHEDSAGLDTPSPGTARRHQALVGARKDRAKPSPTAPPALPSPPAVVPLAGVGVDAPLPLPCSIKRPWSAEEDRRLVQMVQSQGAGCWAALAQAIPSRVGKQCRERWHNHLCPNIRKGSFTEEEDRAILEAVAEHGTRWAQVVKYVPGRTDNAVKNRWNSVTRKLKLSGQSRGRKPASERGAFPLDASAPTKKQATGHSVPRGRERSTGAVEGRAARIHTPAAPRSDMRCAAVGALGLGEGQALLPPPLQAPARAAPRVQPHEQLVAAAGARAGARFRAPATALGQPRDIVDTSPELEHLRRPQAKARQRAHRPPPAAFPPPANSFSPPTNCLRPLAGFPRRACDSPPMRVLEHDELRARAPPCISPPRPSALLRGSPQSRTPPAHPAPALTVLDPSDQLGQQLPRFRNETAHASALARFLLTQGAMHTHNKRRISGGGVRASAVASSEANVDSAHTTASTLAARPGSSSTSPTAVAPAGPATSLHSAGHAVSPEAYDACKSGGGGLGLERTPEATGLGLLSWLSSLLSHPPDARPSPPALRAAVALAQQLTPSNSALAPNRPRLAPNGLANPNQSAADCSSAGSPTARAAPLPTCLTHRKPSPALQHRQLAAAAAAVAQATTHAAPPTDAPAVRQGRRWCPLLRGD